MADITVIRTAEGRLYLVLVVWSNDAHEMLVELAARIALARCEPGLLHHSDHCSQYTAANYWELLTHSGIFVSMSGKGDYYDNALVESFFGTLKIECMDWQSIQS